MSIPTKTKKTKYLYTSPALLVIGISVIFPIVFMLVLSFQNVNSARVLGNYFEKVKFVDFSNYTALIFGSQSSQFWKALSNTIIFTTFCMIFQLIIAIGLALILNMEKIRFKAFFRTIFIIPWTIPGFITTLVWRGMFNQNTGFVNQMLAYVGIQKIPWTEDPLWTMVAIIIIDVWCAVPFMMLISIGALQSIDKFMYEAADMDGATSWQKFYYITKPALFAIMYPAIIMTTFVTFKNFDIIWLYNRGLNGSMDLIMSFGYRIATGGTSLLSISSAFAIMIFILLLCFSGIGNLLKKFNSGLAAKRGNHYGSNKGKK